MDSDDGPNFSYAYGGSSAATSAPSWNPALRHEKEPSPKVSAKPPVQVQPESSSSSEDEDEDEEEDSDEEEDEEEESSPTAVAPQSAPRPLASEGLGARDVDEAALVSATPALSIKSQPVVQPQAESSEETDSDDESEEESSEEEATAEDHLADNYEHQGETTALEEAVTESVRVPLVADTEADDWGSSGDAFELGEAPEEPPLETPLAEAVGTTVGDSVIGNTTVGGNAGEDTDWGNAEEQDDFFGAGALQTVESAQPTDQTPGAHVVQTPETDSAAKSEWDLDLDLDDEFLSENEDAPVFELSDDEGFLEDGPPEEVQQTRPGSSSASRYTPQVAPSALPFTPSAKQYAPQSTQFANLSQTPQQRPAAYNGFGQNLSYQQQQPTRPAMSSSAQSFADKSKGGYSSPYDMPDDIVTTRKRQAPRTAVSAAQPAPPPPRTSSISSNTGSPRPIPTSNMSAANLSPPSSGHSMQSQMTGLSSHGQSKIVPPAKPTSSDFFAELPVTSKPRPSGRYTPQQNVPSNLPPQHVPPQLPPKERTASWSTLRNEILPDSNNAQPPLRQPEQLPMFPNQPSVPTRTNSLPVPQLAPVPPPNRYSPAPPPSAPLPNARYSPAPPPANPRYSPAPSSGSQGQTHTRYVSEPPTTLHRTTSQPFAPRTSSPLAFHSTPQYQENVPDPHTPHTSSHHVSQSVDNMPRPPFRNPLGEVSEIDEPEVILSSRPPTAETSETPTPRSTPSSIVGSPRKRGTYTPQYQPSTATIPARAQTQSPSASMKQPVRSLSTTDQLGSAYGFMPSVAYGGQPAVSGTVNTIPHRRQASLNYDYITPQDESINDPLERWKGHPVFVWGLGGTVVTSFPKQIPRYGGGASAPMMKSSPGEIRLQSVKDVFPLSEETAKFPGPLKNKSKKKDVAGWLGRKIDAVEAELKEPGLEHSLSQDDLKRLEDRALLWKIMSVLVEHDGRLDAPAAETAVKKLLSPEGSDTPDADNSYSTTADLVGRSRSNTSSLTAEHTDPRAIEDLQRMLIKGDREKAVWHAVDQRLWGHAMLLSSTLSKDIWKQVVQEFVRKEVKKAGHNNQALAVLYEVFAGNHEDCVDELVPASARAGFQMVSAAGGGAAQNALQGLDKWRETVALILHNRSEGDASALLSLGKLLAQYGRVEAAHTCFLFARPVVHISGVDDTLADLVLIGADHRQNPLELGIDLEPILLTEVYEFALSLSMQGGTHLLPHLQNYKLAHAYQLAEYGYRADAQAYCDAIAACMKATTRPSPYYNVAFISGLDDLSKRLSESPKDGSSSWISKPSMDKVGSSLLSKFNSFIAGDDEGPASGNAGAEVGPFAKIAGDSPSITPSQSNADLYGAYSGYGTPTLPSSGSNSRYAPSNIYASRTTSEQQRPRNEVGGRPSLDSNEGLGLRSMSDSYMPLTPAASSFSPSQTQLSPPSQRTQGKTHSYSPLRAEVNVAQPSYGNPYLPTPPVESSASAPDFSGYHPPQANFEEAPTTTDTQRSYSGYEPPSSSFDTPSYQPYNPDVEQKEEEQQPRKKSFMDDDDDDLATRAAALKISGKSDADKKADEAFRKAAEADAQRDKNGGDKKAGWFGAWFKKDPNAAPGPIKAKLGEESSFVYDTDLGKWVNKKGGASDTGKPAATPPPPKSGPPGGRSISSSVAPLMGPPNSGALRPPTSNPGPQRSLSMPPPMVLPGSRSSTPGLPSDNEGPKPPLLARPSFSGPSGPPSRPGTSMSNASSIDDLLGAPQARKGAGAKKKKGGRYVDVFPQGQTPM